MVEDKRACFDKVFTNIDSKNYNEAVVELHNFLSDKDEEKQSYAQYLLGYINICSDYEERKECEARKYLYSNINSKYPHPHAFVLYASLMKDSNVSENYLKKAIEIFPEEPRLYSHLFSIDILH